MNAQIAAINSGINTGTIDIDLATMWAEGVIDHHRFGSD